MINEALDPTKRPDRKIAPVGISVPDPTPDAEVGIKIDGDYDPTQTVSGRNSVESQGIENAKNADEFVKYGMAGAKSSIKAKPLDPDLIEKLQSEGIFHKNAICEDILPKIRVSDAKIYVGMCFDHMDDEIKLFNEAVAVAKSLNGVGNFIWIERAPTNNVIIYKVHSDIPPSKYFSECLIKDNAFTIFDSAVLIECLFKYKCKDHGDKK